MKKENNKKAKYIVILIKILNYKTNILLPYKYV